MSKIQQSEPKPRVKKRTRKKASNSPRRPHNAKVESNWSSLDELVALVGKETRQVSRNGELVTMSRAERRLRDEVDRALKGEARALKLILGLMLKHPQLMKRERVLIRFHMSPALANL